MSKPDDGYEMGRDFLAQHRLNYQHYIWYQQFGYALHPSIPTTPKSGEEVLGIADIGTGSAIWLLDVSEGLPSTTTQLFGFDISADQYPPSQLLPENVTLSTFDVLDPEGRPAHLLGSFDIIHLRLFAWVIGDNQDVSLLTTLVKLLKPGGHLQWGEVLIGDFDAVGADDRPAHAMQQFLDIGRKVKGPTFSWITDLPKTMAELGLEDMLVDRPDEKPWMRGLHIDNLCLLFSENAKNVAKIDDERAKKMMGLVERMIEEKRAGMYIKTPLQVVVGRKPLST